MIKRVPGSIVVAGWLVASASSQAHHSLAAAYDLNEEGEVSGSFVAFHIVNPHSSMRINVEEGDGSVTEWIFTGGSVNTLRRLGLNRFGENELTPGDRITVTYTPTVNKTSPLGLPKHITYEDGRRGRFRDF